MTALQKLASGRRVVREGVPSAGGWSALTEPWKIKWETIPGNGVNRGECRDDSYLLKA